MSDERCNWVYVVLRLCVCRYGLMASTTCFALCDVSEWYAKWWCVDWAFCAFWMTTAFTPTTIQSSAIWKKNCIRRAAARLATGWRTYLWRWYRCFCTSTFSQPSDMRIWGVGEVVFVTHTAHTPHRDNSLHIFSENTHNIRLNIIIWAALGVSVSASYLCLAAPHTHTHTLIHKYQILFLVRLAHVDR